MRKFALFFSFIALFFLQSCVQTTQLASTTKKIDSSAEKATVVIMRPSVIGYGIRNDVFFNGMLVGYTGSKGYLRMDVNPGVHTIGTSSGNFDFKKIDLEAGKTYYFKQGQRIGLFIQNVKLLEVGEGYALKTIPKLNGPREVDEFPSSIY